MSQRPRANFPSERTSELNEQTDGQTDQTEFTMHKTVLCSGGGGSSSRDDDDDDDVDDDDGECEQAAAAERASEPTQRAEERFAK